jgi:translation initiation factor 2D
MFKKPPTLKPSTPLRSSSRRAFLAHLQALYPVLDTVPPEVIQQVVPNGLKQCIATTSANQKAVIYTSEHGKPLWFEVGPNAGDALQQAQKKGDKNAKQKQQKKLAEVLPTVYTLWAIPSLLPRLPTWAQIVDPILLEGSALMIPGLIPSPGTFPEGSESDVYPPSSSLVAITPYPTSVPMVVARTELDMKDICSKRASNEKGKAATTIHAKGDYLWEMGGKESPPSQEACLEREAHLNSMQSNEGVDLSELQLEETSQAQDCRDKSDQSNPDRAPATELPDATQDCGTSFSTSGQSRVKRSKDACN